MKIAIVHYRDMQGTLILAEPMQGNRLWAIKQTVRIDCRLFSVERVALADGVQHVNVAPAYDGPANPRPASQSASDIGTAFDILFGLKGK